MTAYASRFPRVLQIQGLEVSYFDEHLNWHGGSPAIFDSSTWIKAKPHSKVNPYVLAQQQVDLYAEVRAMARAPEEVRPGLPRDSRPLRETNAQARDRPTPFRTRSNSGDVG
jgi:hypothetical protein